MPKEIQEELESRGIIFVIVDMRKDLTNVTFHLGRIAG
jgi:hypothetical protein